MTDPSFMTGFPVGVGLRMLGVGNLRPTRQQRDAYLRFTQLGDPLADAVVDMFRRLPAGEGRRMFETAVEHGIDAVESPPPELVAFFAQVDAVPYWVDQDKLALAARVIGRTGAITWLTSLGMLALMGGYLASRVTKTLVGTGELERKAVKRLSDTAAWASDVSTPGALDRFKPGFTGTLRVRLMHAMVRAGMSRRPDWNHEEWDEPVNQSTLAGTLMLFGLANIVGSQALGLRFTDREKDAVYHLWRYVGYLLGIDPDILPTNERDNWRLLWIQSDYEFHPDEDSRRLADALKAAIGPMLVGSGKGTLPRLTRWGVTGLLCGYSRLLLGKVNSDGLGLPDDKVFQAAVIAIATARGATEVPRRLVPGMTQLQERIGMWARTAMTHSMQTTAAKRAYSRHDGLARVDEPYAPRDGERHPVSVERELASV
ncbi:oxygenase MpaB family protein [Mycobacterium sp. LTG2003]